MNYLAHLFLAQPTVESRVGNLLGDFAKGVVVAQLPEPVKNGLLNHRAVDQFTDQHSVVKQLKLLIGSERKRFAGIMLDVVFDHYLIKHWHRFSNTRFDSSCDGYYQSLDEGQLLMPQPMQRVTQRVIQQQWFDSYQTLEGIGYALDRIADRIRFDHTFYGSLEELIRHQDEIESGFLAFFPELQQHVEERRLEQ
ncbi:ACP phosphodiesterase [Neptunomonas antarctica]|uniref:Acyl carrier protein phosphodiesterase n=1 Tax=Neptunomonas antarctica TaxID=619304 RepID=A0A1N7P468_9GAMM|nr:ACP phosphodiesterase [Neptunomonas antarctica]SIT05340.1 Acyl carrier protein phosphodiesterase [Neptunomonas antarctica]